MKRDDIAAASGRYEWKYIHEERLDIPVPPEDPAPVHAVRMYLPDAANASPPQRGWFPRTRRYLERATSAREPAIDEGGSARLEAACGAHVRVVWPGRFDDADPDCCARCVEDLNLEKVDISEWRRRRTARKESRWRRDDERRNREEWHERQRQEQWDEEHPEEEVVNP